MYVLPVASSSGGNSTYIYTEDAHILIDAGIPMKKIFEATNRKEFDALIISHEHSDHISSAGAIGRKTGCPIYIHEWSYKHKEHMFEKCKIEDLAPGKVLRFGQIEINTFFYKT
jgi:phosphoribosyl 1,2-cyclic phosphodiesterase